MVYELGEHEREFDVRPRAIAYICEFCGCGDMVYTGEQSAPYSTAPATIPTMFEHKCDRCGKIMLLPRVYPFIDWVPVQ